METGDPVSRLLAALRATRNPVTRMRVLARAWRAVRRMDPAERKLLAAEVGADGAEELLEQLADRTSGAKPALVMQALERLRGSEPEELVRIIDTLRRPDGRRELVERGLEAVRVAAEPAAEPVAEPEAKPAAAPAARPAASAEPPEEANPSPAVKRPSPPRSVATAPRPRPPKPVAVRPPAPAADPTGLLERIENETRLVRRLGLLRAALDEVRRWPVETVGALLDRYPEGWPRRRALSALFEAGIPEDRHGAVFLLERLESPISRRWCLRVLLRRSGWSERERRMLVDRHGGFGLAARSGEASPAL